MVDDNAVRAARAAIPPPPGHKRSGRPVSKPSVDKTCGKCGTPIRVYASLVREFNYCGRTCFHAHRKDRAGTFPPRKDKGIPQVPRVESTCYTCGDIVLKKADQAKKYKRAYCSRACTHAGIKKHGIGDSAVPLGTTRVRAKGYVFEKTEDGWIQQHRVVMARHLGRYLWDYENVHHVNGKRSDNRIENLEVWLKVQPCGQRVGDVVAHCTEMLSRHAPERLLKRYREK